MDRYGKGELRLISTFLLPLETFNGLKTAVMQKRITSETAAKLAGYFLNLEVKLEKPDAFSSLKLAFDKKISVYDATYIALAKAKKIPFLTLDSRLVRLSPR